jgi:hypothetical protein
MVVVQVQWVLRWCEPPDGLFADRGYKSSYDFSWFDLLAKQPFHLFVGGFYCEELSCRVWEVL